MPDIECVTSANKPYFHKYASKLVASFNHYVDVSIPLRAYIEATWEKASTADYLDVPCLKGFALRTTFVDMSTISYAVRYLEEAERQIKARFSTTIPTDPDARLAHTKIDYKWNAVSFGKKAMSIAHALRTPTSRYQFWLDADIVIMKPITTSFLKDMMKDAGIVYFGREKLHSECGFMGFDMEAKGIQVFVDAYERYYKDLKLFELVDGWTDCHAFDAALAQARAAGLQAKNLSTIPDGHVIVKSFLGYYLDHMKGPRKQMGYSPERK